VSKRNITLHTFTDSQRSSYTQHSNEYDDKQSSSCSRDQVQCNTGDTKLVNLQVEDTLNDAMIDLAIINGDPEFNENDVQGINIIEDMPVEDDKRLDISDLDNVEFNDINTKPRAQSIEQILN